MSIIKRILGKDWYLLLIIVIGLFPVFLFLGNLPFSSWDESLFAMRAYHILEHGELLFNFQEFDSYKDHSNRKPFLTTLIQVGFWKLFGISELNLRIPVGIAFFCLLFVPAFFRKKLSLDRVHIWTYALLLLTSGSMIRNHVVRTGDQDVFVCLYMMLAAIYFFLYIESVSLKRRHYLNMFFLFTFCTLYTKTVFAFMFFPGFFLYSMMRKRLFEVIRDKWVYILTGLLMISFVVYNLYMNSQNPFFIEGFINHALGRYGTVVDGQEYKGFAYYWLKVYDKSFSYFIFFLLFSPIILIKDKAYAFRNLQAFLWVVSLSFIFVISLSKTKTFWYLVPVLPMVALIIALNISYCFNWIFGVLKFRQRGVLAIAISLMFVFPYIRVMKAVIDKKYIPYYDFEMEGAMLRRLEQREPKETKYTILIRRENPQTSMYVSWFNEKKGYNLSIDIDPVESYSKGDKVLSCNYNLSEKIRQNYKYEAISDWKSCHLMKIL
jgi:4-amino-4-deoxy-L-arabinose transferase-like glycosyltransferase